MRKSDALRPSQRDKRIKLLSSKDGRTRCHAAVDLCKAAQAGTDISPAIPALAAVADLPHGTDLDAMWAQHALDAAAFHRADLRPALPALLRKLREKVNQYAIVAIRTWASRSLASAAEALSACRASLEGKHFFLMDEFLAELEFLSKRCMPDAQATWNTDRARGVRLQAGRLRWRTSHGWDNEQSIPDFLENGVPRASLIYSTGSWRVPGEVQNKIRAWLGLEPLTETGQDRALAAIEKRLGELASRPFPSRLEDCELCATLGPSRGGSPMNGWKSPAEASRLEDVPGLPVSDELSRCPHCGTFYRWKYEHDCEPFEPETDHQSVSRATLDEVRKAAMEAEFGTASEG
ncbi:MAG: hypothetical protein AAB074_11040 [Planctomycetota bacterium]